MTTLDIPTLRTQLVNLKDSPRLFEAMKALQDHWSAEQEQRLRFRKQLVADQKQEFINGEVIVHSPARFVHNEIVNRLSTLLTLWVSLRGTGGRVVVEKAMISLTRNDYEPDLCYFSAAKVATIEPDQVLLPPPDLVVEVLSPTTEQRDRGVKWEDYGAHGIQEYWIIDPNLKTVERFVLNSTEALPDVVTSYGTVHEKLTCGETSAEQALTTSLLPDFSVPAEALFHQSKFTEALLSVSRAGLYYKT